MSWLSCRFTGGPISPAPAGSRRAGAQVGRHPPHAPQLTSPVCCCVIRVKGRLNRTDLYRYWGRQPAPLLCTALYCRTPRSALTNKIRLRDRYGTILAGYQVQCAPCKYSASAGVRTETPDWVRHWDGENHLEQRGLCQASVPGKSWELNYTEIYFLSIPGKVFKEFHPATDDCVRVW